MLLDLFVYIYTLFYFRDRLASVDRPPPDGDDITSILGSSQIPPRPASGMF